MSFCPSCGHQLEQGVVYCPSCGNKVLRETPQSTGAPNLPPTPPAYLIYEGDTDRYALDKLKLFAIIFIIGSIAGLILSFAFFFNGFFLMPFHVIYLISSSTSTPVIIAPNFFSLLFETIAISAVVGVVIEIIALLQLRSALASLTKVDRQYFGIPSKLTLVAIVALPLLIVGLFVTLAELGPFFSSISQNQGQTPTLPNGIGILLGASAVEGIGGIAILIGYIGGIILGVWRMGSRYNETLFKIAAIFLIIPLLQIIAPILILVGVPSAKAKVLR